MSRIEELHRQLKLAEKDNLPVIVVETERDKDHVVYENRTTGTTRVDLLGGAEPIRQPAPTPEPAMVDRPFDKSLGKILKENADERVIKLTSGAIRTDIKTVEPPQVF